MYWGTSDYTSYSVAVGSSVSGSSVFRSADDSSTIPPLLARQYELLYGYIAINFQSQYVPNGYTGVICPIKANEATEVKFDYLINTIYGNERIKGDVTITQTKVTVGSNEYLGFQYTITNTGDYQFTCIKPDYNVFYQLTYKSIT